MFMFMFVPPSTQAERDSNVSDPLSAALVSVADLGKESTMLTSVVDASVGPIINLIDQLRAVGIEKDIQIPQIAVMGDQPGASTNHLLCHRSTSRVFLSNALPPAFLNRRPRMPMVIAAPPSAAAIVSSAHNTIHHNARRHATTAESVSNECWTWKKAVRPSRLEELAPDGRFACGTFRKQCRNPNGLRA